METGMQHSPSQIVRAAFVFLLFLFLAWIGAWVLEQALEPSVAFISTSQGQFLYWLGMKLLLWVLPALRLLRYSGRRLSEVMGRKRLRAAVFWGGGVGVVLGAIALGSKVLGHQPLLSSSEALTVVSAVVVAPIVEEVAFRGAVLGVLMPRYRFWAANLVTAVLFLGIHLPGWYFQGVLMDDFRSPLGGALSIFVLGLVFGYVAYRSKSVSGSIIAHALNNFFNI